MLARRSVVLSCATNAFRADGNEAAVQTIFNAGTNNNAAFTPSLTGTFINGANERAVTPFDARTLSSFFVTTTYIGAVRDSTDTWYAGWTCNSSTASFGSTSGSCTSIPS